MAAPPNWPHDELGRIDLTGVYLSVDRDSNTTGYLRVGVITRIDGTDADIRYVQGVTFNKTSERTIIRDRKFSPSQLKLSYDSGELTRVLTTFAEDSVTAVNTGTTLPSASGTNTAPEIGDVIVAWSITAGSANLTASGFYHAEVAD